MSSKVCLVCSGVGKLYANFSVSGADCFERLSAKKLTPRHISAERLPGTTNHGTQFSNIFPRENQWGYLGSLSQEPLIEIISQCAFWSSYTPIPLVALGLVRNLTTFGLRCEMLLRLPIESSE